MTLLEWLTFWLGSLTATLNVLLIWISFFLLTLAFVLQWLPPSIGTFWSCRFLSFHWLFVKLTKRCPVSYHSLLLFSCWLGWSSYIIWAMFHGRISLNSVLLLLLVNLTSGSRLELMDISLIVSIRSSLTYFHGFQLLVLLSQFVEITFFVCTNRINLLSPKSRSNSNRFKSFLEGEKLAYKHKVNHFP